MTSRLIRIRSLLPSIVSSAADRLTVDPVLLAPLSNNAPARHDGSSRSRTKALHEKLAQLKEARDAQRTDAQVRAIVTGLFTAVSNRPGTKVRDFEDFDAEAARLLLQGLDPPIDSQAEAERLCEALRVVDAEHAKVKLPTMIAARLMDELLSGAFCRPGERARGRPREPMPWLSDWRATIGEPTRERRPSPAMNSLLAFANAVEDILRPPGGEPAWRRPVASETGFAINAQLVQNLPLIATVPRPRLALMPARPASPDLPESEPPD